MAPQYTLPIVIKFKRNKSIPFILWCLMMILIGLWIGITPKPSDNFVFRYDAVRCCISVLSIIFGVVGAVFFIQKTFGNAPALLLDEAGVTDNSSFISAGFIPWADITGVREVSAGMNTFVVITVSHPEQYLERQGNAFKRNLVKGNYKWYGPGIYISPNIIGCDSKELMNLILAGTVQFGTSEH